MLTLFWFILNSLFKLGQLTHSWVFKLFSKSYC